MEPDDDKTRTHVVLTKGTMVGHYRIVEKIGAGGMGEVYLAEDTGLDRQVALKFLPPYLCQDEDCRKRFKREAQAAAKLDHPNIVTVYEVGEYKGRPYFAMAHIEGQSLKEYCSGKDLSLNQILEFAIQICEGLQAAHEKGITHRDIKPSNIIIDSNGRARIVDFGLATVKGGEHLTKTGSTLGTVGYISPEQIEGKATDARSDLFSLGVVLYELIANKAPFRRKDETATLKAILQDIPEPLARYKSSVPEDLQRIVSKLLEKDPTLRYQSAAGVIPDLKKLSATSTTSVAIEKKRDPWNRYVVPSAVIILLAVIAVWYSVIRTGVAPKSDDPIRLAVLPFENLGAEEDKYFADGITEEITSKLAKVSELIVIGSHSAKQYKGTTKSIDQIGEELGVNYLLCGTVRWQKSDNSPLRVRVTPQLLKVSDGSSIWSDVYESLFTEIFSTQSSIATKVVGSLDIALADSERKALQNVPTNNLEAYEYHIRARDYFWTYENRDDIDAAISLWKKAVDLDSTFVDALVELSTAYSFYYWVGWDPTGEILKLAYQSALTASHFDTLDSYSHYAMGYYNYYSSREYQKALNEFQQALKLRPNDHNIIAAIGFVQRRLGNWERALESMIGAIQIEPLVAEQYYEVATTARYMRKFEIAEQWLNKGLSLFPDYAWFHNERIQLYVSRSGDPVGGLEKLGQIDNRVKDTRELAFLRMTYSKWAGQFQKAINYGKEYIILAETFDDSCRYFTLMGDCYQNLNDAVLSRVYYDSARVYVESRFDWDNPHASGIFIPIGRVYAELGQPQKAVRLARRLALVMPISKDAMSGTSYQEDLAVTYVRVGMYDEAVAILDTLLMIPSNITVPKLRANLDFSPLRKFPKFQTLLAKYEKIHGS